MLFRRQTLDGIARGDIDRAFRRWKRAGAKAGSRVRTAVGVVRIGEVDVVAAGVLTEADAKRSGFGDLAALHEMLGADNGDPVYRIALLGIEPDQRVALRADDELSGEEWHGLAAKFARWDAKAPGYFPSVLKTISDRPGVAAAVLAADAGVERLKFKQDVSKLKELGLTESLEVGYRLSPRGRTVLDKLREHRL